MHQNENLDRYEWVVVLSLIMLLGAITFITHRHWIFHQPQLPSHNYLEDRKLHIQVEGAVEAPGIYHLEKGSVLKDILALAKPTTNADLKKMSLTKKLKDGQLIKVPTKEYITVYLEGAVKQPGALVLPKGTLIRDLISIVAFNEKADTAKLNRKKKLKDGEIIRVDRH